MGTQNTRASVQIEKDWEQMTVEKWRADADQLIASNHGTKEGALTVSSVII